MLELVILLSHQLIFQGMFALKNFFLSKKIDQRIRGTNNEANGFILFWCVFLATALILSLFKNPPGEALVFDRSFALMTGCMLLFLNLIVSLSSLLNLKDSWRVGVLENQQTELITSGIYRFTRNPYFLSYVIMFCAYPIILQNLILLGLSVPGFILIHKMIRKEEEYLKSVHGDEYTDYFKKVPRYFFI